KERLRERACFTKEQPRAHHPNGCRHLRDTVPTEEGYRLCVLGQGAALRRSSPCPRVEGGEGQSGATPSRLADPSTHVRIRARHARRAATLRSNATRSFQHYNDDAVCACRSIGIADSDRHVEPKNGRKFGFWATRGQPMG